MLLTSPLATLSWIKCKNVYHIKAVFLLLGSYMKDLIWSETINQFHNSYISKSRKEKWQNKCLSIVYSNNDQLEIMTNSPLPPISYRMEFFALFSMIRKLDIETNLLFSNASTFLWPHVIFKWILNSKLLPCNWLLKVKPKNCETF